MPKSIENYWFFASAATEFNSIPESGTYWCDVNAPHIHQFRNTDHAIFVACGACPYPSDARNEKCRHCVEKLMNMSTPVFMNRITRWSDLSSQNLISNLEQVPLRWRYKYSENELSAPLKTLLNNRFDVFGTRIFAEEQDTVLFHNCGSCKNPTNSRWKECFQCIQTGAQAVGRIPEFIILAKMTTQKWWPSIDKDVFSIDEKIIGMSIKDLKKISKIVDDITRTDDLHKRILLCNKGIKINCWIAPLWALRGEALYYLNDLEEALSCYEKAIQLVPDNKILWFNRGFILKALGKTEYALASFEKALTIDPYDTYIFAMRESCLEALGRDVTDETKFYESACPYCGIDIPLYAQFCHNCGKPLSTPRELSYKRCAFCQCTIPVTAQFCPFCGARASADPTRLY